MLAWPSTILCSSYAAMYPLSVWAGSQHGHVLLAAGAKGKRYALPNSTIHMHQAMGGARGEATQIAIIAKEILREQDVIRSILVKHTSQSLEKIARDTDRDFFMSAEAAMEYG